MAKSYNFTENHTTDDDNKIISKIQFIEDDEVIMEYEGVNTDDTILNLKDAWLSLNT